MDMQMLLIAFNDIKPGCVRIIDI